MAHLKFLEVMECRFKGGKDGKVERKTEEEQVREEEQE